MATATRSGSSASTDVVAKAKKPGLAAGAAAVGLAGGLAVGSHLGCQAPGTEPARGPAPEGPGRAARAEERLAQDRRDVGKAAYGVGSATRRVVLHHGRHPSGAGGARAGEPAVSGRGAPQRADAPAGRPPARGLEHLDAVALGEGHDLRRARRRERPGGAHEALDLGAGREDDVRVRVGLRFVADRVGAAAGDVDDRAGRRGDAVVLDVDRQLAALDAVDLAAAWRCIAGGPPPAGRRTSTASRAPSDCALVTRKVSSSVPTLMVSMVSPVFDKLLVYVE